MKTGALLSFSVKAGGRVAGAPASTRTPLKRYGDALGAAFQMPTIYSTPRATRRRSASASARTPDATRRPSSRRSGWRPRARRDALVAEAVAAVDATGLGAAGETLREAARFVAAR